MNEIDFTKFDTAWTRVEYDLDLFRGDVEDDIDETPEQKKQELISFLCALAEAATALAEALRDV